MNYAWAHRYIFYIYYYCYCVCVCCLGHAYVRSEDSSLASLALALSFHLYVNAGLHSKHLYLSTTSLLHTLREDLRTGAAQLDSSATFPVWLVSHICLYITLVPMASALLMQTILREIIDFIYSKLRILAGQW